MSNIILTNRCNIRCPFCFATENSYGKKTNEFDENTLWKITNFINKKDNLIRLCGGEPTLNTHFTGILECLLYAGYNVFIMTNGLWPKEVIDFFVKLPPKASGKINFLFNILEPGFYSTAQISLLYDVLSLINPNLVTIGITIYTKEVEYKYLFEICDKYSIKKIRISIAAENILEANLNHKDYHYDLSTILYNLVMEATCKGIKIVKDCSFIPPCYFSKEQLVNLKLAINGEWNFTCSKSAVDVDASGNAWRCYGLFSVLRANVHDFSNEYDLRMYFDRRINFLSNNMPAYKECATCRYWLKGCTGGCYTHRITSALAQKPDLVLFPMDDDNEILKCKPVISSSVKIKRDISGNVLIYNQCETIINPDDYIREFIYEIDGNTSVSEIISKWVRNFDNYEKAHKYVIKLCRKLFEDDIIDINYEFGISLLERTQMIG